MLQSEILFETVAGEDYYVMVAGYDGVSGLFDVTIRPVPCPAKTCQSATMVESFPFVEINATNNVSMVPEFKLTSIAWS
jgi:hypothetical protein